MCMLACSKGMGCACPAKQTSADLIMPLFFSWCLPAAGCVAVFRVGFYCTHDASTCAPYQLFTCAGVSPPLCTGFCKQLEYCLLTVCPTFGLLCCCLPACLLC
jgi:hypothetical protein